MEAVYISKLQSRWKNVPKEGNVNARARRHSVPSILGNTKEVPGPGALIATASVSEVRWKRLERGVLVLWLLLWSKMM